MRTFIPELARSVSGADLVLSDPALCRRAAYESAPNYLPNRNVSVSWAVQTEVRSGRAAL